jgi:hypothetical protein
MVTTNILNHQDDHDPMQQPIQLPRPDLDALLQSSLAVDFGSDVTPIQIWANISRLTGKGWAITKVTLDLFIQELSKYMRCNG